MDKNAHQKQYSCRNRDADKWVNVIESKQPKGNISPQNNEYAVGQIDYIRDPPDQSESHTHTPIYSAYQNAINNRLYYQFHLFTLSEVFQAFGWNVFWPPRCSFLNLPIRPHLNLSAAANLFNMMKKPS